MREKTGATAVPNKNFLNKILIDATTIAENERQDLFNDCREIINKRIFNEHNEYNQDALKKLFKELYDRSDSEDEKKSIKTLWLSNVPPQERINFIADYFAKKAEIPSQTFIENINKFVEIINNDNNLELFIANPQNYIYNQPNLSAFQQEILKQLIADPQFSNLPSFKRRVRTSTNVETSITYYTKQLNFQNYISIDASRFPQCINKDVEQEVLANAKKQYNGPPVIGMGALPSYSRKAIERTADSMKKMGRGACHNFAQLAADHLLKLMEEKKIASQHLKMVSHDDALGSHTYLLLGHDSDDLTDLSNCLIIDGWAVAMGHQPTSGVFTMATYPFPDMTSNLVLCYDNQAPVLSHSDNEEKAPSHNKELGQRLALGGFFSRTSAIQKEEALNNKQKAVIDFLKGLNEHTGNSTKKALFKDLIDAVKENAITPENGARMAALAFHARSIEVDRGKYSWRSLGAIDESVLSLFNNPAIVKLWSNYAVKHEIRSESVAKIDRTLLEELVKGLNETEEHSYNTVAQKDNII